MKSINKRKPNLNKYDLKWQWVVIFGHWNGLGPWELSICCNTPHNEVFLWHHPLPLVPQFMAVWPAPLQSHRGSSADSQAGQQAFGGLGRAGGVKGISSLGEDQCRILDGLSVKFFLKMQGGGGRFRSAPSWQAPRRTLAPAFPRYLAVPHRHWLSPPWSGPGPPSVHTADQSEWQTDASPGGLRPVTERDTYRITVTTLLTRYTLTVSQYRRPVEDLMAESVPSPQMRQSSATKTETIMVQLAGPCKTVRNVQV